jgi:hypothetical protein
MSVSRGCAGGVLHESRAYSARRDCGSPVPAITTSHFVLSRVSMLRFVRDVGREKLKTPASPED